MVLEKTSKKRYYRQAFYIFDGKRQVDNKKPNNGLSISLSDENLSGAYIMFAIIKSGGKQYKVKEGAVVKLEKIEKGIGESIEFDHVLMLQNGEEVKIGSPTVEGAKVVAEVVEQGRGEKIRIIKFRRRKHSMKRQGHRQYYTAVKVTAIQG